MKNPARDVHLQKQTMTIEIVFLYNSQTHIVKSRYMKNNKLDSFTRYVLRLRYTNVNI